MDVHKMYAEMKSLLSQADEAKKYANEIYATASDFQKKADEIKKNIVDEMVGDGCQTSKLDGVTISLRKLADKLVISGDVPDEMCEQVITMKPNKVLIQKHLEENKNCNFAHIENGGYTLQIRDKGE